MQIALLADIHGNIVALEAVLADIERHAQVDAYWILGDLVAIGPAPVKVLERLSTLPNARFIRGNTDRYVCTGDRPSPSVQQVKSNLDLLPILLEVQGSFSWTQGAVTASGWFEWLASLPLMFCDELPDGTTVLAVHAAPYRDEGQGFQAETSAAEAEQMVANCDVGLICVGHTHYAFNRTVNGKCVINPGAITGNPTNARASYALLKADPQGYQVEHRQVTYNQEEVVDMLYRIKHLSAAFISKQLYNKHGHD